MALLLILAPSFQNAETVKAVLLWGYGGSTAVRGVANAVYVAAFSPAVAMEKSLPFYEMARTIYINRYIQRLEALFILLWVMVGIIGIAASLYGALYVLARVFRLPTARPLMVPVTLIMIDIAALPPDAGVVLELGTWLFTHVFAPGFAATTALLAAAAWRKAGRSG